MTLKVSKDICTKFVGARGSRGRAINSNKNRNASVDADADTDADANMDADADTWVSSIPLTLTVLRRGKKGLNRSILYT